MQIIVKNSLLNASWAFFCLVLQANSANCAPKPIDVVFLTQSGSRVLKSWTNDEILKLSASPRSKKGGVISAQKFLFEESTNALDLNDRASIDLVTITTDSKTIRVPRFMIWRGFFQFKLDAKNGELSSQVKNVEKGRILVPAWYFETTQIRKIELSDHLVSYPQTKLRIRTNPAASRGEKIFTQNCLACHSVTTYGSPNLNPTTLTKARLGNFSIIHKKWPELQLDARGERGLIEYSEALALESAKIMKEK
jgi:hypothetical protein